MDSQAQHTPLNAPTPLNLKAQRTTRSRIESRSEGQIRNRYGACLMLRAYGSPFLAADPKRTASLRARRGVISGPPSGGCTTSFSTSE